MNKLFNILIPVVGITLLIAVFMGYTHVTATGGSQLTNKQVLEDRSYLSQNQEKYGNCQYTVEIGDFSIATVTNKYYNQGVNKEKLELLENQFKDKYKAECQPVLDEYRARYTLYQQHQKDAAAAELSQLDRWLGKKAEVISERSPIMGLYQEYDPKSLQYPTNPNAKILYTQDDYDKYVSANL
jgi:hypothetical protein